MKKTATKSDVPRSASLPQINDDSGQFTPRVSKEGEGGADKGDSFAEEAKIVAEIGTTAEALDSQAIEVVEKELKDIRAAAHPQPKIPPDLEDAGVINPQEEADKVIRDGSSLELPISENKYKEGLKEKAKGRWFYREREVVGVGSLVAFALWVSRLVKRAHKHTMKVVFRKGGR